MASSEEVPRWYDKNVHLEEQRLRTGKLEYEVTLHYILDAILSVQKSAGCESGLRIADIGCGTGVYGTVYPSSHLSKERYQFEL